MLAGGLRRRKRTDRQKGKNNQETKMRFYGTSSKLLLYNTKMKLEIESENQFKNQNNSNQRKREKSGGRNVGR